MTGVERREAVRLLRRRGTSTVQILTLTTWQTLLVGTMYVDSGHEALSP